MKRLFTNIAAAAVALTTVGSTAALAQYAPYQPPYHHDEGPGYYHHWHHGDRFYGPRHEIDWRHHGLRQPPYGYRWVQDGPQFLLLNVSNGFVADVVVR